MRLHRFFVEAKIAPDEPVLITDGKLLHQWRNVLRLKVGSEVVLFDGSGTDYHCELVELTRRKALSRVLSSAHHTTMPRVELHLFASLLKKERFEWLLEKTTELGVSHIHPVIAERSEVKQFNLLRARDIVREAAEQSGRGNFCRRSILLRGFRMSVKNISTSH